MRLPDNRKMSNENTTDVVDFIFAGHDHCYKAELNKETGVHFLISGTDFEAFTNFTVLFDVSEDDYKQYYNSIKE